MPTQPVVTFSAQRLDPLFTPEYAHEIHVGLAAGTYPQGTVLGEVSATPGVYKAYVSNAADGSQNPAGLLKYACTVDAQGNITSWGEYRRTSTSTDMYYAGTFRTQELVGLDANAVTKLGGLLVEGTVTTGIVRF